LARAGILNVCFYRFNNHSDGLKSKIIREM
jgi:hypothetical protein